MPSEVRVPAATLTLIWSTDLPSAWGVSVSVTVPGGTLKKMTRPAPPPPDRPVGNAPGPASTAPRTTTPGRRPFCKSERCRRHFPADLSSHQSEAPASAFPSAITPATDEVPEGGGQTNVTSVHVGVDEPMHSGSAEDASGASR
jgi:hypothetical protein